jgi:hypothetical protein
MTDQPHNINLDGMLNADDIKKLTELLGNNSVLLDKSANKGKGNGKNKGKMTPQAKNQLLSQLSSHQTIQQNQKSLKDMNEQEKKEYREELKKRLHNKQDMYKQMRSNQNLLQKNLDAKVKKTTETIKKEDVAKALQSAIPLDKVVTGQSEQTEQTKEAEQTENLEDFVN